MARLTAVALLGLLIPHFAFAADSVPNANSDQAAVVQGNNAFAVELYQHLKDQPGNLFFSPESISTALAMTYAGARGQTAAEMAKVLHFALPPDKLHPTMGKMLAERNAAHDGYQLKESDALWGQQGYTFLSDFLTLTKNDYGAAFHTVDFAKSDQTTQTINDWVAQQTNDKITNVIGQGILTPQTRLVLTNAIYFKGDWKTQFDKKLTTDDNFFLTPAQAIKVPMMHRTDNFQYFDGGTFQELAIPYKGKELSMVVFLPRQAAGLAAFEQSLTSDDMQRWLDHLRPVSQVIVTLPTFTMSEQFGLADTLAAMGMQRAFAAGSADFTGIALRQPLPAESDTGLYIRAVLHQAYIDVNEEGTEAAAATAVDMGIVPTIVAPPPPPIIFRANHPFVFLIYDDVSHSILFMGRVTNPLG